ncbi:MAG: glycosyltransferase [Erysipelotrichales bacterium]|nr:glycosyltransferase [Erysipelotrichales bacterium]
MSKVAIVYAISNLYFEPFSVSLVSLFENSKNYRDYSYYILNENLSIENHLKLDELFKINGGGVAYRKIDIDSIFEKNDLMSQNLEWNGNKSRTHLFSLMPDKFITNSEDIKYLLFLGADTLINKDINQLFKIDFGDNLIAGVPEFFYYQNHLTVRPYKGLNGDVLLYNFKKWKEQNISNDIIQFYNNLEQKINPDSIISYLFQKRIIWLPIKYNYYFHIYSNKLFKYLVHYYSIIPIADVNEVLKGDYVIIHYASLFARPWLLHNTSSKSEIYHHYLKSLPFEAKKEESIYKCKSEYTGLRFSKIRIFIKKTSFKLLPVFIYKLFFDGVHRKT